MGYFVTTLRKLLKSMFDEGTVWLLKQRSVRDRLGRARCGGGLPEDRTVLHLGETAIQETIGGESARAEETGRHDV